MKLEPLMTYYGDLKPFRDLGVTPFGNRIIADVLGGGFEGPKLKGRILESGGDWLLIDAEGVGHLDVRATFETDDGALIYLQYYGKVVITQPMMEALVGKGPGTEYGDAPFFTQPRFETSDPRYTWLNRTVAVAEGRFRPNRVEYRVYACAKD
jgi:hypothetical protein